MRIQLILIAFFIFIFQLHALDLKAQRVTLNLENARLEQTLEQLTRQTGYDFIYNPKLIKQQAVNVTILKRDISLEKALDEIFDKQPNLDFTIDDKTIVLHPRKQSREVLPSAQQRRTIRGTVSDASGNPISNVSVKIKNTSEGTSSDASGKFELETAQQNITLVFSSLGYQQLEVKYNNQQTLTITLIAQESDLEEVVVVGYGTQRKSDLTGSIVSLQEDKFTKGANTNAFQLLNGKVSGVNISQTSAAPGASTKIQIRGAGSINSSNDALVVVDGLPGVDPASLSMDDVESIDILKDASAAAIYGTRAANGVVIITTKKGEAGKTVTQYSNYFGVQNASRRLEVLNGEQYMRTLNSIREESGKDPIYTQEEINQVGVGTDWQDEVFRNNAPVMNHQLSFSGGGENSRFYSGLTYYDQDGLVKSSGIKKINLRANAEFTPKSFLKFSINANYTNSRNQSIFTSNAVNENAGPLNSALQFDPTLPSSLDGSGRYYLNNFIALDNPLALIYGIDNHSNSQTFYGLVSAEVKPFEGFTTTFRFGGRATTSLSSAYTDRSTINGLSRGGIGTKGANNSEQWLAELIANYEKTWASHHLTLMAGTTFEQFTSEGVGASAMQFLSDVTSYHLLQSGKKDQYEVSSSKSRNRLNGVITRINYDFNKRYLLTLSLRADGTSRFSENHKFAFFPSAAFAWRVSDEPFLGQWAASGNDLKFRIGFGRLGNQGISDYQTINTLISSGNAVFGDEIFQGVVPARLPNPNLKWETTQEINLGVDFSMLKGRLYGSLDLYKRNTIDQLFSKPIPSVVGHSSYMVNFGDVENRGVDLQLNSVNVDKDIWRWESGLNVSLLKNEVKSLPDFIPQLITGSIASGFISNFQLVERGNAMLSFYGYETEGIYQNQAEIDASAQPNAKPGDIRFVDQNGDGKIDLSDRTVLGKPFPSVHLGLNNQFNYKNWRLDFMLQYVGGISMLDANISETLYPTNEYRNRLAEYLLNRWTPENPTNKYPSGVNPTDYGGDRIVNSLTVQDASFLRLKNVNLSYQILSNKFGFQGFNVFLAMENLATWTKYKGYDPDASATGSGSVSKVSFNSYPLARTVRLGVQVSL